MSDLKWEDAPDTVQWEDAPEKESKASKLMDKAFHSAMKITGPVGEAASNFVSGIPAALGGGLTYLGGLATGDTDAAMHIKHETEKAINGKLQYESQNSMGKKATEKLNQGMQAIIESGGPSMQALAGATLGQKFADENALGLESIGKAYNEMALNVIDPLAVAGMVRGSRGRKLNTESAEKIAPRVEPKWEDAPNAPARDRGVQGTPENPQGQLWSAEHDTPTNPISSDNQLGLFDKPVDIETIPYELSVGDVGQNHPGLTLEGLKQREDTSGPQSKVQFEDASRQLQMDDVGNGIDFAPETPPGVNTYEKGQIGSRDTARAKASEEARADQVARWERGEVLPNEEGAWREWWESEQDAHNAELRSKRAAFEKAEAEAKARKETDFNKMEAQKELDFAESASRIEATPARNFFTDPHSRDLVDFHSQENTATLKSGEQIHMEVIDEWNGDPQQGAIIARDAQGNDVGFMAFAKVEEAGGVRHNPHVEVEPHMQRKGVATAMYDLAHQAGAKLPKLDQHGQARTDAGQAFRTAYEAREGAKRDHQFAEEALGDKSLMGHEATTSLVDALRKGDVHTVLDIIAKNHENVAYRNLADYLKGKLEGIKIKLHDEGILTLGDRHATGYYDPTTRTVGFSKVGAVSPHTVLHELVHAITSDFINTRPNDLRVLGIKDLYVKLGDMGMSKEFPQIVNAKEFLAEAFSNPEFQSFLKEHRLSQRSAWRRFVDNVKSILGLSASVRNHITDALEHTLDLGKQIAEASSADRPLQQFKDAGMPSKLADLMATKGKRPEPVNTKNFEDVQRLKVPGLEGPISDFTFYDKPMAEIVEMAKAADDIPNTVLEKMSHWLQAGGLFESLKTRNPVVKYTYERITRATQEAARMVKENLTDPETGLVPRMRELTPREKGEVWAIKMMHEGDRVLSAQELRQRGLTEKQVAYYQKQRQVDDHFFDQINEARKAVGLQPMNRRVAHIAGRFMGDFSRFVFNAEGKIVGRIAGSTRWELDNISKFINERHPEWQMGKREYNTLGKGKRPADRFSGLMEALNFITKTDSDAGALMESYQAYMQKDAIGYLNATRHAKAKVKEAGGIVGSEGNKPWETVEKNAEEGMKAQIAYFEQGYSWIAMEKAINDLKPLLGNEEVMKQTPNAAKWAEAYKDHALGRNQGSVADAANWTASKIGELTGVGHGNLFRATNHVKHFTMQKFMGLLNIPFSITQLMQPLQVHPAMITLLKNRGLEFSAREAQVKAAQTHLNMIMESFGQKVQYSPFEQQAIKYARDMGIMDVKMADHTKDINQSKAWETYHKIADMNIEIPERLTRGTSFLFYSHLLKDAGIPAKDIFGAAENMTNMTMVNYHPIERPMGYAKLGWLGDIASTLTRYKHNQASQVAFYAREGIMSGQGAKGYTPMAAFLATSLAFGGVMGFFGFQEADALYQLVSEKLGKPDTLTSVVLESGMPEIISHGVFSTLGLDMTTRFSNANLIPDSVPKALMPFGSAVLDMAEATGRFAMNPTSTTRQKQLVKAFAPQSAQGIIENQLFTEKQADGSNLYQNSTEGPNMGRGRVFRSEGDMALRNFGFRNIRESKELAKNYSNGQIEKANENIVKSIQSKAQLAAMDGTLTENQLKTLINRAAKYGQSPDAFVSEFTTWSRDRHLSQAKQQRLRNALSGFKGAVNIKEGR